jgi:hypothetical protein
LTSGSLETLKLENIGGRNAEALDKEVVIRKKKIKKIIFC